MRCDAARIAISLALQVDVILMTDISKYTLHKPIYFLRSFPANCLCNFFLRDSNSS